MTTQVVDLGYRPRRWSADIRTKLKRFNVLVVHRGAGKSWSAIAWLVDAALRTQRIRARYSYLAPRRNQVKGIAWDQLKALALMVPGAVANESELHVTFPNGAQVRLYGADDPDALRGLHPDGLVVDEIADMKEHAWGEVLRPALHSRQGWVVFIGTPKGHNLLHKLYADARDDAEWFTALLTHEDTGVISEAELESMRKALSPAQFRQELMCSFEASSDDVLITLDMIEASCKRTLHEQSYSFAPTILGVDVARHGGDRAAICRRQGLMMWPVETWLGISNTDFAGEIASRIDRWKADATFIDAGRGEGVIDILRSLGYKPQPVDFGGSSSLPGCANKAADMWSRMAEWVREGGCLPPKDRQLHEALSNRHYTFSNAANRLALVPKSEEKGHLDEGDSAALTFAQPVAIRGLVRDAVLPGRKLVQRRDPGFLR